MAGEYWRDIQNEIKRIEEQRGREEERRQRDEFHRNLEKQLQAADNFRRAEEKKGRMQRAKGNLRSILEDIRANSPDIRRSRLSAIVENGQGYELRWGDKFDLTPHEREIMSKYHYSFKKKLFGPPIPQLPEQILAYDYRFIDASVSEDNVYSNGPIIPITTFIANPKVILPNLARAIAQPRGARMIYKKGSEYWKPEPPPSYPTWTTTDTNGICCCT